MEIKGAELESILRLKPSDIKLSFMKEMFANTDDRKKKYDTGDTFTLKAGKLRNKTTIRTTIGRYVMNLFLFEKVEYPYINEPVNKNKLGDVMLDITEMLLEDEINEEVYADLLNRQGWLGWSISPFITSTMGYDDFVIPAKTAKLKKELLDKYAEEIEAGDTIVVSKIEKLLIASALEELKGTPALDIYAAGCRGSVGNNLKNMLLIRGLVSDPSRPGKFKVSTSNLVDGTPPEEMVSGANILLAGAGGRAIQTRKGGYMSKQLVSAFQGIVLGPEGSNCKTLKTINIKLTAQNSSMYKYRYIVEKGNKLVKLDKKTMPKYIGSLVKMRTPMHCESEQMCNMCYGHLPYILGLKNIGLTFNAVGEKLKNLSMKSFHDATIHLSEIDLDTAIVKV